MSKLNNFKMLKFKNSVNDFQSMNDVYKLSQNIKFFYFIKMYKFRESNMKKLIINEKNLPKINKLGDSNIRRRVNKGQNIHDSPPVKKSLSMQIQELDHCIESLQDYLFKNITLEQQKVHLMVHFFKSFKEILNPNQQLMTQSLKFTKLKFKSVIEIDQKQNCMSVIVQKAQNNVKQIPASDRINRLAQKPNNCSLMKNPKIKKYVSMHKKSSEQNDIKDQLQQKCLVPTQESHNQDELVQIQQFSSAKSRKFEPIQQIAQYSPKENVRQPQIVQHEQQSQILKLQDHIQSLGKDLQQKTLQVTHLHQRIEQLNINIENLVKKNTQKSEDFNKIQEEKQLVKQSQANVQLQLEQLKERFKAIEVQKQFVQKIKIQIQKEKLLLETYKKQKIQQELGRYETAQQFYELTRKDLREENEQLMHLLEERECELTNLYQVVSEFQERNLQTNSNSKAIFCEEVLVL